LNDADKVLLNFLINLQHYNLPISGRTEMKKVLAIIASGLVLAFVGCGLLNPTNSDSVTFSVGAIDSITVSQAGNQTKTITATITGENEAPTLNSIAIKTSADAAVATTAMDVSYSTPTTSGKEITTTITLTVKPAACNGNYKLVVSATSGSATSSQETTFKLIGHDCSATVLTPLTGKKIYNRCGAEAGAYDLVGDSLVHLASPASIKDLRDTTTTCGQPYDSKWASLNGSTFLYVPAAQAAQYTGSAVTAELVKAAAAAATSSTVGPLAVGDVVIAKLGASAARGYALIVVTAITPTDGTGTNKGSITFTYYFTAN
jgi:hypothetical protein